MSYRRTILTIAGMGVLIYVTLSMFFYLFQDNIIFQPERLKRDYVFQFNDAFEEYFIPMPDGVELNALLFRPSVPAKGFILYFHGNADNLQRWGNYAGDFTKLGYDVLIVDYRGYGKSGGRPKEADYYSDAQTILAWVRSTFQYNRLVIYGRSLGSAIATNLAVTAHPDLLILETPFDELWGAISPILKTVFYFTPRRYTFSNRRTLPEIDCRKLILHGTDDWVVPLSSALRLKPLLKEEDDFVVIEGGGHNDLREYEEYHRSVGEFLE